MPDIRTITEDDVAEFRQAVHAGFGGDVRDEPGEDERFLALFPLETSLAAFDRGRIVATFGSFDMEVTVPGGVAPMAGTTIVTVHPAYRRQGLLTRMMRTHLDQAVDLGQTVAGLWSSETAIYGRFGYGVAAVAYELEVDGSTTTVPPARDGVMVRPIDAAEAEDLLPAVYEAVRQRRPGYLGRSGAWWVNRVLYDPEHRRGGASAMRIVVAEEAGNVLGYAMYRQKEKWEHFLAQGAVKISELVAVDDGVRRALWHFLFNYDLFRNVNHWNLPVDDPLIDEVSNRRHLTLRPFDSLWLRPLDIPAYVESRSYAADGVIRLGVVDTFRSAGSVAYEVVVEDGRASCSTTGAQPDLEMDVAVLGSISLGGMSARRHFRAGRITGTESAVAQLDGMVRSEPAPHCPEIF